MENDSGNFLDQFIAALSQALSTLKFKAGPLLTRLSDLTGLAQDTLFWALPLSVVLLIPVLVIIKRLVSKKPGVQEEPEQKPVQKVDQAPAEEFQPKEAPRPEPEPKPEPVETKKDIAPKEPSPSGILRNIRTGLSKTRKALSSRVDKLFSMGRLDEDMLEELEEILITSDVGVETSLRLIETLSGKSSEITSADDLKKAIKEEIYSIIDVKPHNAATPTTLPHVIMVVGVNGVGKTTTIGKLASRFVKEGKKVLIVAADTFRAAAADQLAIWAERSGAEIVRHKDNSDPAAVAFDGMEAALSRKVDIVMIDTAGRLHTKKNLMEELKKIQRTVEAKMPGAPHETLMVVDGTTGQNALQQAKLFNEAIGISSIALTKLDGTAKGGIVIGISHTLNVPLKYIGIGEQIEDLQDFNPKEFADAIL